MKAPNDGAVALLEGNNAFIGFEDGKCPSG